MPGLCGFLRIKPPHAVDKACVGVVFRAGSRETCWHVGRLLCWLVLRDLLCDLPLGLLFRWCPVLGLSIVQIEFDLRRSLGLVVLPSSYKTVKGRSHTVEKRTSMHPHKPHAISQPCIAVLTHAQTHHRLTTQPAQPMTAPPTNASSRHQHWHRGDRCILQSDCKASIVTQILLPRDDQPSPAVHLSIPPLRRHRQQLHCPAQCATSG